MTEIGHNGGPALRDAGWYATHRDMLNHPIVGICKPVSPADPKRGSASRFEAWHWLIANAAFAEREWMNKGQKQTIRPGQLVAGRQYLAHTWNWTEKTVRVFLRQLLDEHMVTLATDAIRGQQRANTANIITLCNYLTYQLSADDRKADEGPARGHRGATEGPAKGQIDNKDTTIQVKDSPPPPVGGEPTPDPVEAQPGVFDGIPAEPPKAERDRQDVTEAFAVYGLAADHFKLAKCQAVTKARSSRMAKRLADLGGIENFKTALRALGNTADPFVAFLRGKVQPRAGEQPFRLDIDRLMQTDGGLGDVLAKLIDISAAAQAARQDAAPAWGSWSPEEWDRQIDAHANGIWPWAKLGPPPGSKGCACPPDILARRRLTDIYDQNGISRGRH